MITCREVSTLVSNDRLGEQPLRRRLAVRMHLMMCRGCRRFASEIEAIRRGARLTLRSFDHEAGSLEEKAAKAMEKREEQR
jgi:anti-sigma factor ChrR (cupin superfamily)